MILLGSLIAVAFIAIFFQLREQRQEMDLLSANLDKVNRILRGVGRR